MKREKGKEEIQDLARGGRRRVLYLEYRERRERGKGGSVADEEVEREWAQKCTDDEQRAFGQPERGPGTQPGYKLQTNRPACGKETKDKQNRTKNAKHTQKKSVGVYRRQGDDGQADGYHRPWAVYGVRRCIIRRRGGRLEKGARPTGKGMPAGKTERTGMKATKAKEKGRTAKDRKRNEKRRAVSFGE